MGEFTIDRENSERASKQEWIDDFYRKVVIKIKLNENIALQKQGVDKIIEPLHIEEKIRFSDYGDILLEEYSNWERQVLGWMMKDNTKTDVLSYVVLPSHKIWLYDYSKLKNLWDNNYLDWLKKYGRKKAKTTNENGEILYHTSNIPVPESELTESLLSKNFD